MIKEPKEAELALERLLRVQALPTQCQARGTASVSWAQNQRFLLPGAPEAITEDSPGEERIASTQENPSFLAPMAFVSVDRVPVLLVTPNLHHEDDPHFRRDQEL